jgi:UDP-N-acetylmuramate dehydrogenase
MIEIAAALRDRVEGSVTEGASLAEFTTYRIGGPADILVEAERPEDLVAVAEVSGGRVPIAIVGRGSNLLVSDEGFRGIAVRLGRGFRLHEAVGERDVVFGGAVHLPAGARWTARMGLAGFEFAAEIPATFGGAVRMNAGAHARSMSDVLVWADTVDLTTGEFVRHDVSDLGYSYRHSSLRPEQIVVAGQVHLEPGDPKEVAEKISSYLRWRRENQPGGRSAGSVFKNPAGDSAGRLIEEAGLKGARSGGAEVSLVHANFIVADRDAAAADVWSLIVRARALVRARFGVDLEPEVRFLGEFPQVEAGLEGQVEG